MQPVVVPERKKEPVVKTVEIKQERTEAAEEQFAPIPMNAIPVGN